MTDRESSPDLEIIAVKEAKPRSRSSHSDKSSSAPAAASSAKQTVGVAIPNIRHPIRTYLPHGRLQLATNAEGINLQYRPEDEGDSHGGAVATQPSGGVNEDDDDDIVILDEKINPNPAPAPAMKVIKMLASDAKKLGLTGGDKFATALIDVSGAEKRVRLYQAPPSYNPEQVPEELLQISNDAGSNIAKVTTKHRDGSEAAVSRSQASSVMASPLRAAMESQPLQPERPRFASGSSQPGFGPACIVAAQHVPASAPSANAPVAGIKFSLNTPCGQRFSTNLRSGVEQFSPSLPVSAPQQQRFGFAAQTTVPSGFPLPRNTVAASQVAFPALTPGFGVPNAVATSAGSFKFANAPQRHAGFPQPSVILPPMPPLRPAPQLSAAAPKLVAGSADVRSAEALQKFSFALPPAQTAGGGKAVVASPLQSTPTSFQQSTQHANQRPSFGFSFRGEAAATAGFADRQPGSSSFRFGSDFGAPSNRRVVAAASSPLKDSAFRYKDKLLTTSNAVGSGPTSTSSLSLVSFAPPKSLFASTSVTTLSAQSGASRASATATVRPGRPLNFGFPDAGGTRSSSDVASSVISKKYARTRIRSMASRGEKARLFRCRWDKCGRRLPSNVSMFFHMIAHYVVQKGEMLHINDKEDVTSLCRVCFQAFSTPWALESHMAEVHRLKSLPSAASSDAGNAEANPKKYVHYCYICERNRSFDAPEGDAFESVDDLKQHMIATHNDAEMPYACPFCTFASSLKADVYYHFRWHHAHTFQLLCPFCLMGFPTHNVTVQNSCRVVSTHEYSSHVQQHFTGHLYCRKCSLAFVHEHQLLEHQQTRHAAYVKTYSTLAIMFDPETARPIPLAELNGERPYRRRLLRSHECKPPPLTLAEAKCIECKRSMAKTNHFDYSKSFCCDTCAFQTSCSASYIGHLQQHLPNSDESSTSLFRRRMVVMDTPAACLCGYATMFGNRLARHIRNCGESSGIAVVSEPEIVDNDHQSPSNGFAMMLGMLRVGCSWDRKCFEEELAVPDEVPAAVLARLSSAEAEHVDEPLMPAVNRITLTPKSVKRTAPSSSTDDSQGGSGTPSHHPFVIITRYTQAEDIGARFKKRRDRLSVFEGIMNVDLADDSEDAQLLHDRDGIFNSISPEVRAEILAPAKSIVKAGRGDGCSDVSPSHSSASSHSSSGGKKRSKNDSSPSKKFKAPMPPASCESQGKSEEEMIVCAAESTAGSDAGDAKPDADPTVLMQEADSSTDVSVDSERPLPVVDKETKNPTQEDDSLMNEDYVLGTQEEDESFEDGLVIDEQAEELILSQ